MILGAYNRECIIKMVDFTPGCKGNLQLGYFVFITHSLSKENRLNQGLLLIPHKFLFLWLSTCHWKFPHYVCLWAFPLDFCILGSFLFKKSITPFISWVYLSSLTERCISNENFDGRYFSDLWQTREYKVHMKTQGFEKCYCFSVVTRNSTT